MFLIEKFDYMKTKVLLLIFVNLIFTELEFNEIK